MADNWSLPRNYILSSRTMKLSSPKVQKSTIVLNSPISIMRKRTAICDLSLIEDEASKKQKLQKVITPKNGEIYSYNRDNFRTFDTPSISAFCLHSTEPLIAISSHDFQLKQFQLVYVTRIYTLDGDLVTCFEASNSEKIYLSATTMITLNTDTTMTRYNDYSVKDAPLHFSCFDCDMDDVFYGIPYPTLESMNDDGNSNIDIYSPDLEYIRSFEVKGFDNIFAFRIKGDFIAFINYTSSRYTVTRYSLSKE